MCRQCAVSGKTKELFPAAGVYSCGDAEALVMVFRLLEEGRVKWQKVRIKAEDIAWIEEASKALEQEPIKLEFLEEALVV